MQRKEVLCVAVIGGVVGAILVMAAGLIAPLGAQNEVKDAEFGKITCRRLEVSDPVSGETKITLGFDGDYSYIAVKGKQSPGLFTQTAGVFISASEDIGKVRVYSPKGDVELVISDYQSGGVVRIHPEIKFPPVQGESPFPRVKIGLDDNGDGTVSTWDKNGNRSSTLK